MCPRCVHRPIATGQSKAHSVTAPHHPSRQWLSSSGRNAHPGSRPWSADPPKEAPCGLLAPPGAWRCDNHPVLGADLLHAFGNTPDLQGAACLAHRDLFNRCTEPGASAELPAGDPDMSARVPRLRPVPGLGRKLPLVLLRTALRTGGGQTYSECVVEGPHLPSTRHRCSGSSGAVEAAQ